MPKVDTPSKASRWSRLESMVSMDVSKMSFPITYYEPITLLQRMAEDMEYSELLDTAAGISESSERMLYVAAFAISAYASNVDRFTKPFDPILGETYEFTENEKRYRFVAEQVRSEPPTGAVYAEGGRWTYWGENVAKSRFAIHSIEIEPLGAWFVQLCPADGSNKEELYCWRKVSTRVSGFLTGSPVVDQCGKIEITNCTTSDICCVDFKARGWRASSAYRLSGKILNGNGVGCWDLSGHWNDKLCAQRVNELGNVSSHGDPPLLIWQAHERPKTGLTDFAKSLNGSNHSLERSLPRTDSRLRPDRHAVQRGRFEVAAEEKQKLEEDHKLVQQTRHETNVIWTPLWFGDRITCESSGEHFWTWKGTYWQGKDRNIGAHVVGVDFQSV